MHLVWETSRDVNSGLLKMSTFIQLNPDEYFKVGIPGNDSVSSTVLEQGVLIGLEGVISFRSAATVYLSEYIPFKVDVCVCVSVCLSVCK